MGIIGVVNGTTIPVGLEVENRGYDWIQQHQ